MNEGWHAAFSFDVRNSEYALMERSTHASKQESETIYRFFTTTLLASRFASDTRRASVHFADLTMVTRMLPLFSRSSSKRSDMNIVAQPSQPRSRALSLAKRIADCLQRKSPPASACASRTIQNPSLFRPMKNSGITGLRTSGPGCPRTLLSRPRKARCVESPVQLLSCFDCPPSFPANPHMMRMCSYASARQRRNGCPSRGTCLANC